MRLVLLLLVSTIFITLSLYYYSPENIVVANDNIDNVNNNKFIVQVSIEEQEQDDTQRRLELEEPYSGKSRAVHKISKTA